MFAAGVEAALRAAVAAHQGQTRKGPSGAPYIIHPVHVALLVARWGYGELEIQVALLHDVVEDCDDWTVERLTQVFGTRVATIVDELSEDKDRSWEERKEAGIRAVPQLSAEACVVKAADKLHNLQSLLAELREHEDADDVWRRFKGGREGTLEKDGRLIAALSQRIRAEVAAELHAAYAELERQI